MSAFVASLVASIAGTPPALAQSPGTGVYVPLAGARIFDTRNPVDGGVVAAKSTRSVQLTGRGGIPVTGVLAVVVDLTVFNNTSDGCGILWQAGATQPIPASSINYAPGRDVTNAVTTKVGAAGTNAEGKASFYTWVATDMLIDVVGYYRADPGGGYVPLTQARVMNTNGTKIQANTTFQRKLRGDSVAGIPDSSDVSAVVLNVTVYNQTNLGYLTIWPGGSRPLTSAMNYPRDRAHTQMVVATLNADGWISVYNSASPIDMLLDVVGYYTAGSGARYVPLTPTRIVDTRLRVAPIAVALPPNSHNEFEGHGRRRSTRGSQHGCPVGSR